MKALSIRGPWWWFILHLPEHCWKNVENRDWNYLSNHRGETLIHASKEMTKTEYKEAVHFARTQCGVLSPLPSFDSLPRGGIVGMVKIIGHVKSHASPWFTGPTALVLANPWPEPFRPCKGALGFFEPEIDPGWRPSGTAYQGTKVGGRKG